MFSSHLALLQRPVLLAKCRSWALLLALFAVPAFSVDISNTSALAGKLISDLGVTSKQAEGGAGALLKLAGEHLSGPDFAKITSAIPDASALISAAPSIKDTLPTSGLDTGDTSGSLLPIIQQFKILGLDTDMIGKFASVISKYLESSGGSGIAKLFEQALPAAALLNSSSGSVMDLLK